MGSIFEMYEEENEMILHLFNFINESAVFFTLVSVFIFYTSSHSGRGDVEMCICVYSKKEKTKKSAYTMRFFFNETKLRCVRMR
jgi:hypothetical protein